MKYKTYTLQELVTIKYGKNQKKVLDKNGTIPIYGTGGLIGWANNYLYDQPSVLIGRKGTINKVKYVEHPFWTVDTLFYTKINKDIVIPKYLYYLMSLIDFNQYNEGTTIPSLRTETLNRMKFSIPSLEYQQRILTYLNPIDKKIAINKMINNNLNQQTSAIFNKWFMPYISRKISIPNEWKLKQISEIDVIVTDYVANGSFKSLADNVQYLSKETNNVLIRLTDYNNGFDADMVYISDASYNFLAKSQLFGDEVIISNVGVNAGTVFRCPRLKKNMSLAPNAIMLSSKKYEHYLYAYFTSAYGQQLLQSIITGSVQPKFNKTNFRSLKVIIPSSYVLNCFNKLYSSIYEQIVQNQIENIYLIKLRDSLLPKLMSGKIDVSSINL